MPTWGEILAEIQGLAGQQVPAPLDVVRRKYLAHLHSLTRRNTILYCGADDPEGTIGDEDVQALMEVFYGLSGPSLDLIVQSPGGSAEATEAMVQYIRSKFIDVRVFVPLTAMSAATMLACSANVIVMGKHSFLGPIDPQIITRDFAGIRAIPAQAVLDQFELAKEQCKDPRLLGAWLPMLSQYGPALLIQCQNAIDLSESLVSSWLRAYMFAGEADAEERAAKVAKTLANHQLFKTHGRHLGREKMKEMGLRIQDLEADQKLQDAVLSVFHAASHTLQMTPAVKIVENHEGKAFIRIRQLSRRLTFEPVPKRPVPSPPQPSPDPAKGLAPDDS